ncbi:MAG: MBL fold metallo-hydrolase [Ignavibacteriales bacterium]|nr:MBL fold metallo-hydrolase [Ignavibacteriales bacterium]
MLRIAPFLLLTFLASGCSTWAARMFTRSMERISDPIAPAPASITTPVQPSAELAVAWVGHATALIQLHDRLIITDPLFTRTVGIVVKRFIEAGLDPSLLPRLDATLISHMHFDHFSFGSIDQLPKDGILVIPTGALRYTPEFGFRAVHELEPWEAIEDAGLRITAVPVQHFSGRYGFDGAWMRDHGFTGYIVEYKNLSVFFAGDTGYHTELFKEIGRRFSIDLAVIPIGPGGSWEIGSRIHVHPRGALMIFQDVQADYMLPVHHKTLFYGFDQDPSQSIMTLRALAAEMGLADRIIDIDIGEQKIIIPFPRPVVTP